MLYGGKFNFHYSYSILIIISMIISMTILLLLSLVLLLLLLEQFVDLPLDHAGVLADDAVLVHAGEQQQEVHYGHTSAQRGGYL